MLLRFGTLLRRSLNTKSLALYTVAGTDFAFGDVGEFGLDELATNRRDAIGEDMTLEVVVLVLDNACRKTVVGLGMLGEVLVHIANGDAGRTNDILRNARQGETTLGKSAILLALLDDLRIDKDLLKVLTLRIIFG